MFTEVTQQNRLLIIGKRYERHLWRLCGKTACAIPTARSDTGLADGPRWIPAGARPSPV